MMSERLSKGGGKRFSLDTRSMDPPFKMVHGLHKSGSCGSLSDACNPVATPSGNQSALEAEEGSCNSRMKHCNGNSNDLPAVFRPARANNGTKEKRGDVEEASAAGHEAEVSSPKAEDTANIDQWRTFLTNEQQLLYGSLRSDTAVLEETLRLQQSQVHFMREEAQISALYSRAENFLEEEQFAEREEMKDIQKKQSGGDTERQQVQGALQNHFSCMELAELEHADLRKAYKQLQIQQSRMQREREAFNLRMIQREERQQRERKELLAANARKARNQQVTLEFQMRNLSKENQDTSLKIGAAAATSLKLVQTKAAEQLRELQLLQQRNTLRAFEYDQNCKVAVHQIEAQQLLQTQKLHREHAMELSTFNIDWKRKIFELEAQQKEEHFRVPMEVLKLRQKDAAKKLQRKLRKEAIAREEARRAEMESDFVEFLTVLQEPGNSDGSTSKKSWGTSLQASDWSEDFLDLAEDLTLESVEDVAVLEKRLREEHARVRAEREAIHAAQLEDVRARHNSQLHTLLAEQAAVMKGLKTKQQEGATALQGQIEEEMKSMKASHVREKDLLEEAQEKSLSMIRNTIDLERGMSRINEEHKKNLNDFLSFICHELRNPLCAISACIELIQTSHDIDNLGEETAMHLRSMVHQTTLMRTIVNDVLDLQKIEEGKLDFVQVSFSPAILLEDVIIAQRSFAASIKRNNRRGTNGKGRAEIGEECNDNLQVLVDIHRNVPQVLVGDPTRLRQILSNLIGNAVKFTPRGTVRVKVSVLHLKAEDSVTLKFEVIDTGCGMTQEDCDKLFKKYQQVANQHRSAKVASTGLGLAICKTMVNQMGGEIGVESKPDQGSTFWFVLPFGISDEDISTLPSSRRGTILSLPLPKVDPIDSSTPKKEEGQEGKIGESLESPLSQSVRETVDEEADDITTTSNLTIQTVPDTVPLLPSSDIPTAPILLHPTPSLSFTRQRSALSSGPGQLVDPSTIPARRAISQQATRRTTMNESFPKWPSLSVLLAEDSEVLQRTTLSMLERFGIRADVASNGQEALDMFSHGKTYDLFLTDIQMPHKTGNEVAMILRKDGFTGLIVACTANAMPQQVQQCMDAGMDEVLLKPFSLGDLNIKLTAAVEKGLQRGLLIAPCVASSTTRPAQVRGAVGKSSMNHRLPLIVDLQLDADKTGSSSSS